MVVPTHRTYAADMEDKATVPNATRTTHVLAFVLVGSLILVGCSAPKTSLPGSTVPPSTRSAMGLEASMAESGQLIVFLRTPRGMDVVKVDPTSGDANTVATIPASSASDVVFVGGHLIFSDGNDEFHLWDVSDAFGVIQVPGCGRHASGFGTGNDVEGFGNLVQRPGQTAWIVCSWGTFPLEPGVGTGDAVPGGGPFIDYFHCFDAAADVACTDLDDQIHIIGEDGNVVRSVELTTLLQGTGAAAASLYPDNAVSLNGQVFLLVSRREDPSKLTTPEHNYLVRVDLSSWQITKIEQLPDSEFAFIDALGGLLKLYLSTSDVEKSYLVDHETLAMNLISDYTRGPIAATADYLFFKAGDQKLERLDLKTGATSFLRVVRDATMGEVWAISVVP
jgi:hypothetical protein